MKIRNIYRVIVGIIMIIYGAYIMFFQYSAFHVLDLFERYTLVYSTFPGFGAMLGGIMSIISIKKNVLLFFSSILFFIAGIICVINFGFYSFSIMCFIFCFFNIIFYEMVR